MREISYWSRILQGGGGGGDIPEKQPCDLKYHPLLYESFAAMHPT
jgi:hypothetical protein